MIVFRIALRKFGRAAKDAFSGQSGFFVNGRWHGGGRHLDYAAENRSLATLERLVHYKRFDHLAPHVIYRADIPGEHIETVLALPAGWDADDPSPAAQSIGNAWFDQARSPALQAPSAVMPGEYNLILNTRHPLWDWNWIVEGPTPFRFDRRLVDLMNKRS